MPYTAVIMITIHNHISAQVETSTLPIPLCIVHTNPQKKKMCINGPLVYDCPECCPIIPASSDRIGGPGIRRAQSLRTRIHKCAEWNVHYHYHPYQKTSPYINVGPTRLDDRLIPDADQRRLRALYGVCSRHGVGVTRMPDEDLFEDLGFSEDFDSDSDSDSEIDEVRQLVNMEMELRNSPRSGNRRLDCGHGKMRLYVPSSPHLLVPEVSDGHEPHKVCNGRSSLATPLDSVTRRAPDLSLGCKSTSKEPLTAPCTQYITRTSTPASIGYNSTPTSPRIASGAHDHADHP